MKKTTPRNLSYKISGILFVLGLAACQNPFFPHYPDKGASAWPIAHSPQGGLDSSQLLFPSGSAIWARSAASGPSNSFFVSTAVDSSGNVYAAGFQSGGPYVYGTVSLPGLGEYLNPVLVKYDPMGKVLWARSISYSQSPYPESCFNAVETDKFGNIIVAGYFNGDSINKFGDKSVKGKSSSNNPLLIKYNTNGEVLWVRTLESCPGSSYGEFSSVALDDSGNIYVAGCLSYNGDDAPYSFGYDSVPLETISGAGYGGYWWNNCVPILVKYSGDGRAQWAKTIKSTTDDTVSASFLSLTVQQDGNEVFIYAAGEQRGENAGGIIQYGTSEAAKIPIISGGISENPLLVKYDAQGDAVWARTFLQGLSAVFNSVAVGQGGAIFAAGSQTGCLDYDYGNGAVANGFCETEGYNPILVMYNSYGEAQWARSSSQNPDFAYYSSVAVDGEGNAYAAGYQVGEMSYQYGSIVSEGKCPGGNSLLVKYDKSGTAIWAKTINGITNDHAPYDFSLPTSVLNDVAADRRGFVYTAGVFSTLEYTDYGDGQTDETRVKGFTEMHLSPVLVKYRQ